MKLTKKQIRQLLSETMSSMAQPASGGGISQRDLQARAKAGREANPIGRDWAEEADDFAKDYIKPLIANFPFLGNSITAIDMVKGILKANSLYGEKSKAKTKEADDLMKKVFVDATFLAVPGGPLIKAVSKKIGPGGAKVLIKNITEIIQNSLASKVKDKTKKATINEEIKISQRQLRKFISESLSNYKTLHEAAMGMGPRGLAELSDQNITFEIKQDGQTYFIIALQDSTQLGKWTLDPEIISCGYYLTHSEIINPETGTIGPFGYDLMIELGTLLGTRVKSSGQASGLGEENVEVGTTAAAVWVYYNERRNDVEKEVWDFKRCGEERPNMNVIVAPTSGGGHAAHYVFPKYYHEEYELEQKSNRRLKPLAPVSHVPDWMQAQIEAMNQTYTKPPVFLSQLKSMNMLSAPSNIIDLIPDTVSTEIPSSARPKTKKTGSISFYGRKGVLIAEYNPTKRGRFSKKLGMLWAQNHFGDEAKYWEKERNAGQFELYHGNKGWVIIHNINAPNETVLYRSGEGWSALERSELLQDGDVIAVGRLSKDIVKTMFVVSINI